MKKIIITLIWFFLILSTVFADKSVIISAVVGNINHAPTILKVSPNSNPKMLQVNKTQIYSIYIKDDEKDTLYYNIIPNNGYTSPMSGTISQYDTQSGAYINFLYLAPASANPNEKITIILNDTSNITTKELSLHIY